MLKLALEFSSIGDGQRRELPIGGEAPARAGLDLPAPLRLSLALRTGLDRVDTKGKAQPDANSRTPAAPAPGPAAARHEALPASRKSSPPPPRDNSPPPPRDNGSQGATPSKGSSEAAPQSSDSISAAVIGGDEFLPADELADEIPTPPSRDGRRDAPSEPYLQPTQSATRRWGVAPVRWGGDISVGWSQARSAGGEASSAQVYQGRLRANSYLVQPYIALVSTDFMLTTNRTQSGGDSASNNLTGTSVSGTGNLNVFPQSRFPLSATLSLSDSRSEGSFNSTNVARKQLSLRQQYRPPVGDWHTAASYDRSQLEGDFGTDVVDRLFGDYSNRISNHSISLNAELSRNTTRDSSSRTFYAGGSHSTTMNDTLFWSNSANVVGQNLVTDVADQSRNARLQSAQVFTFLNWIPQDSKLRANGSLRYFQNRSDIEGNVFEQRTLSGNGGLNYQVSRNLSLSGGVGFGLDKDGNSATNQSASAGYSGDTIRFGEYSYNWSSSFGGSGAQSSLGVNSRSISASANHSLTRSWQLSEAGNLNASLGQSFGNSRSTGQGAVSSSTLSHSASLSLSARDGERLNGFLNTSLSDSRTMGETQSTFQMLTTQISGSWTINRFSSLQSNLTWQLSRQESDAGESVIITDEFGEPLFIDTTSESTSSSLGGSASYGHRQFFGVRGLRYQADFRANTGMTRTARRFGDPNANRPEDQVSMQLDQRLLYSIGRFDTELIYSVAEIQGSRHQRILLRATRSFGAF